ncbi:MAG: diguanylate cyclase [Firmicutes bacterium]|nr:diguanylate cyclase [Bacillota bacterium]
MAKKSEKILIVDDMAVNVEYLKKTVSDWGYEAFVAYKGLQALKVAQESKPDLVLLDVMMPDLTGYEVCRALKINPETAGIPVIFLTAKGEIFDRIEGLDVGAHDYVAKPFHPEELKARIRNAIRHKEEKEKLIQETAALKAQTIIDELTGFYNRRYLEERLQEELARAKRYNYPISLALISADGFDMIRKTYSRARGDSIIKQIGEIMKRNIRAIDIVTRFQDDVFAVILPQTGHEGSAVFGEKIRKIIERHLFYGIPEKTRITSAIGVSAFETDNVGDMDPLIAESAKALQQAKAGGGNKVVVFEV